MNLPSMPETGPQDASPAGNFSGTDAFTRMSLRMRDLWIHEYSLSVFCILIACSIVASYPLAMMDYIGAILMDVLFTLLLFSGVLALADSPKKACFVAVFGFIAVFSQWWGHVYPSPTSTKCEVGTSLIMNTMLAVVMLAHTFRHGRVTLHRIQGAVAAYLLLGVSWADAYMLVELFYPGSFSFPAGHTGAALPLHEMTYFSFTTLTTLGYGDATALHPFARSLTTVQGLVGQLFPAILIARLVSMELQEHASRS